MVTSWKTRATGTPSLSAAFIQKWMTSFSGTWGDTWRRGDCIFYCNDGASTWCADHVVVIVDFVNGSSLVDAHTGDHYHIAAGNIPGVRRWAHLQDDITYTY